MTMILNTRLTLELCLCCIRVSRNKSMVHDTFYFIMHIAYYYEFDFVYIL